MYHNIIIHQIVIKISFDGCSYCEYRSRKSDPIISAIDTTIWLSGWSSGCCIVDVMA